MKNHTAIPVTNLERLKDFYKLLGFVEIGSWEKPSQKLKALILCKSDYTIELVYHPSNKSLFEEMPEVHHLAVEVEDLESQLKNLEGKVEIIKPLTKGMTVKFFAFIKDPDGFSIELFQN